MVSFPSALAKSGTQSLGGPRNRTILCKVRWAADLKGQPSIPEAGLGVGLFYCPRPSLVSRHCV